MLRKYSVLLLTILILVTPEASHARSKKLVDPAPITFEAVDEITQVSDAINGAVIQKGWVKEGEQNSTEPHSIDAAYYIRTHKILVEISYNTEQIVLTYKDSENMKFKARKKKTTIHPNYMAWSQQLADQIKLNIDMGEAFDVTKAVKGLDGPINTPPKTAFNQYNDFVLKPTTLAKPYQGHKGNEKTVTNLDHNLGLHLKPLLEQWSQADGDKTLLIEPEIEAVRFIGTGARIWVGAWAGRSWILVKLRITDQNSGELIGEPQLYRVAGVSSGFTVSRNDYKMVEDMANDIKTYIENNYTQAVGGGRIPPVDVLQNIKKG